MREAGRLASQVLAMIERKAAGEEIAVQPEAKADDAPAPDLMSALKASLDAVRDRTGEAPATGRKPATRPAASEKKPGTSRKPAAAKADAADATTAKKAPAKKAPAKKKDPTATKT